MQIHIKPVRQEVLILNLTMFILISEKHFHSQSILRNNSKGNIQYISILLHNLKYTLRTLLLNQSKHAISNVVGI